MVELLFRFLKEELNYYKILGVHEKASNYELRKAFCKLTKELHPDTTALNKDEAKTKLQSVLEAYENLNNPKLRNLYDIKLKSIFIKNQEKNLNIRNAYLSDYNSRNFMSHFEFLIQKVFILPTINVILS